VLDGDHSLAVLENIEVYVRCGLHAFEYERPNRLLVSVWQYGRPQSGQFIDYDLVRNAVVAWQERPHVELLETLLEDIMAVAFSNPLVLACRADSGGGGQVRPGRCADQFGVAVQI
jgi:dihydroneopterin aldolase